MKVPKSGVQFMPRQQTHVTPAACSRCGALVDPQDHQAHRNWHRDNDN